MAGRAGSQRRARGFIRKRGNSFQVLVYAGPDPLTGKDSYLTESARDEREAEKIRTRLLAQVDAQRAPATKVTFGYVLDAWLKTHDADPSTVASYARSVERRIRPALGEVPVAKINARLLEQLYADLRQCRDRCHRRAPGTDLDPAHECRPYAPSTIRETHSIISGALSAAVRWEWIPANPADVARKPRQPRPKPSPPSSTEAARILATAAESDASWGMFVWLAMITGARRGELVALRWHDIDVGRGIVEIRRNWVDGVEKETKTHQIRRISIDETTASMLAEQHVRYTDQMHSLGLDPVDSAFVFSYQPDHSRPCDPDAISHRYSAMCTKLSIRSHLHALRHYTATELISAGVDIRTVAGRLGHGGGGTTTLRVYTAWVAGSDKRAADILASRMRPPANGPER